MSREQAGFPGFGDQFAPQRLIRAVRRAAAIPFHRYDFFGDEGPCALLQVQQVRSQIKIHGVGFSLTSFDDQTVMQAG
jgi:hypothetical protein